MLQILKEGRVDTIISDWVKRLARITINAADKFIKGNDWNGRKYQSMSKHYNRIILSEKPIGAGSNKQLAFPGIIMRLIFIYIPTIVFCAERGVWQWGTASLFLGEAAFTCLIYYKIVRQKSPYAVLVAVSMTFHPFLFFISSLVFMLVSSKGLSWLHILFIFSFCFSVFMTKKQLKKVSMKKIITHVKRANTFEDTIVAGERVVTYTPCALKSPDFYGAKISLIDKILSKWIWFPAFLVLPVAQLSVFTTPYRDFDVTTLMVAVAAIIMAIGANIMTFHLFLNWRLLRMKERGQF